MKEENKVRDYVRQLLVEELTKSDKKEIERIARKQAKLIAKQEVESAIGKNFSKSVAKEVEKVLKNKATKEEMASITKAILIKFYRALSTQDKYVLDKIKL